MSDNTRWQQFNSIIDALDLDIKEKGLLLVLFRHVNYKTGYANPSRALIKKKTGISDNRTLDKIFNNLINKGYLIRESGKGNRSKYFIKVGGEIAPSVKNAPSGEIAPSVKNAPSGEITPLLGGEITPLLGGEITPQKEKKRKRKENIKKEKDTNLDKIINSYSDDEELKDTICDFLKMRKSIKRPMTDRALKIMLNKLDKYGDTTQKKILILENSIENSWQGIFPLKEDRVLKQEKKLTDMF